MVGIAALTLSAQGQIHLRVALSTGADSVVIPQTLGAYPSFSGELCLEAGSLSPGEVVSHALLAGLP